MCRLVSNHPVMLYSKSFAAIHWKQTMNAKSWVTAVSMCGFVTAALAGIKFVQISQAIAFMESSPAYDCHRCRRRG